MRRPLPTIHESVDELRAQLQGETHALKRPRWHMLYLLASGQAATRQQVADLLGIHRNTVGRWLTTYEQEGLAALLHVTPPPGATPAVNADQQAQLRAALSDPHGFASYGEVQDWLRESFGIAMEYQALHKLVRYKLGAKLKVARPSHPKKTNPP